MYRQHVPVLAAGMRSSPRIFARGIMFAILSARVQFSRVGADLRDTDRLGRECPALWGWKIDAFEYVMEHKRELYNCVMACPLSRPEAAIHLLTRIPGMGIVKAAFVAQMIGFDVACLDTRNIQREGLNPRAYRSDGDARKSSLAFERKIERYVEQTRGRAQELWDAWCQEIACIYKQTPEDISAAHLEIVPLKNRAGLTEFSLDHVNLKPEFDAVPF